MRSKLRLRGSASTIWPSPISQKMRAISIADGILYTSAVMSISRQPLILQSRAIAVVLFNPLSEQIQDLSSGLSDVTDLETLVSSPYGADQILAKAQEM